MIELLLGVFTLVTLNTENLFDCRHDTLKQDTEFLPTAYRHWTRYRYWRKLDHVAQTVVACGANDRQVVPDLVALQEVENDSVLTDLTRRSVLREARYEYVMTHSADERGIDVALLYQPFTFRLIAHHSVRVALPRGSRPTRDILYAKGLTLALDTLHILVVHAPSRAGGEMETRPYRMAAVERVGDVVDSIRLREPGANILVAGDFNDTSRDASVQTLGLRLRELSAHARGSHGARGTYRYRGVWQSLDHIFASQPLAQRVTVCEVADFPFLLRPDEKYGGHKPRRNYEGMRWQDGYSDHLPLLVRLDGKKPETTLHTR